VLRERQVKEKESASLQRAPAVSADRTLLRADPPTGGGESADLLWPVDSAS
jgi:hypothetical protein